MLAAAALLVLLLVLHRRREACFKSCMMPKPLRSGPPRSPVSAAILLLSSLRAPPAWCFAQASSGQKPSLPAAHDALIRIHIGIMGRRAPCSQSPHVQSMQEGAELRTQRGPCKAGPDWDKAVDMAGGAVAERKLGGCLRVCEPALARPCRPRCAAAARRGEQGASCSPPRRACCVPCTMHQHISSVMQPIVHKSTPADCIERAAHQSRSCTVSLSFNLLSHKSPMRSEAGFTPGCWLEGMAASAEYVP